VGSSMPAVDIRHSESDPGEYGGFEELSEVQTPNMPIAKELFYLSHDHSKPCQLSCQRSASE
jgi:hypothetical protein